MDNLSRARSLGFETEATNKVLRDTYTLLATTLIPTIIGGLVSVHFGLAEYFRSGWIGFIVTMVLLFGLTFAIQANKENKVGLGLLYVLTFFLGILLSGTIERFLNVPGGGNLIALAFVGTMMIFGGCAAFTSMFKMDINFWGKFLMVGFIALIIGGVATFFFQATIFIVLLLVGILVLSSIALFWELSAVKQGYETSPVSAALGIYLNLYNIFTSLLQLLGIVGGDD